MRAYENLSDEELLRLTAGEPAAFDAFYLRHERLLGFTPELTRIVMRPEQPARVAPHDMTRCFSTHWYRPARVTWRDLCRLNPTRPATLVDASAVSADYCGRAGRRFGFRVRGGVMGKLKLVLCAVRVAREVQKEGGSQEEMAARVLERRAELTEPLLDRIAELPLPQGKEQQAKEFDQRMRDLLPVINDMADTVRDGNQADLRQASQKLLDDVLPVRALARELNIHACIPTQTVDGDANGVSSRAHGRMFESSRCGCGINVARDRGGDAAYGWQGDGSWSAGLPDSRGYSRC